MATEEPMNLVLEHLRHIRGRLDSMDLNMHVIGRRMSAMEHMLSGGVTTEMQQNEQLDMLKARVERIERRLDLVD